MFLHSLFQNIFITKYNFVKSDRFSIRVYSIKNTKILVNYHVIISNLVIVILFVFIGCLAFPTIILMLPILDDVVARGCWERHGAFL